MSADVLTLGVILLIVIAVVIVLVVRKNQKKNSMVIKGATHTPDTDNPPPSQSTENRFCNQCGARLPEGAMFCNKCGNAVS